MGEARVYPHWSRVTAGEWRWPDFSPEEMACRGTGRLVVDEEAMDKLQEFRDAVGAPFIVNSAYRSPEHNKAVGGAKSSYHLQGRAFDISMANHDPAEFKERAERMGWGGIGTYPAARLNFIHIDTGPAGRRWGDPFPARPENRFAPESAPPPIEKDPVVLGTGSVLGVALGWWSDLQAALPPEFHRWALGGVAAVAAVVVAKRLIDRKKGRV